VTRWAAVVLEGLAVRALALVFIGIGLLCLPAMLWQARRDRRG